MNEHWLNVSPIDDEGLPPLRPMATPLLARPKDTGERRRASDLVQRTSVAEFLSRWRAVSAIGFLIRRRRT